MTASIYLCTFFMSFTLRSTQTFVIVSTSTTSTIIETKYSFTLLNLACKTTYETAEQKQSIRKRTKKWTTLHKFAGDDFLSNFHLMEMVSGVLNVNKNKVCAVYLGPEPLLTGYSDATDRLDCFFILYFSFFLNCDILLLFLSCTTHSHEHSFAY